MSKGKKRREARRRARERHAAEQGQARPPDEGVSPDAAAPHAEHPGRGGKPERAAASEARHSRAARKKTKRKGGLAERVGRIHVSPWLIATPVVAAVGGVLAFLVLTSGSSGTTGGPPPTPTPDPRVAGLPIDITFNIEAGDDGTVTGDGSFFRPDALTADAGDVVELVVTNTGSVTHNIWVAGPDNEYDTPDDFGPINLISPGDTDRLVVKMDDPDVYLFRCQIHPLLQFGTLTLN